MQVSMPDGRIVDMPDGLSHEEQVSFLKARKDEPSFAQRTGGILTRGYGGLLETTANIGDFLGVQTSDMSKAAEALYKTPQVQRLEAFPAQTWYGKLGTGLLEFAPQLPLYAAGEGAVMGGLRAVPKLASVAKALTAVKGEGILPSSLKAATRAGGAGALVGTLGAPPESTAIERAKHGAEEAIGFATSVGVLHPAFKILGKLGGGLARRLKDRPLDKNAQELIRAEAEARRQVEPGIDEAMRQWDEIGYQELILPDKLEFKGLGDAELRDHLDYLDQQYRTAKGEVSKRISEETTQVEQELEQRDAARAEEILGRPRPTTEPTIAEQRRYVQSLNRPVKFGELDKESQAVLTKHSTGLTPDTVLDAYDYLSLRARVYQENYTPEGRAQYLSLVEFAERMAKKNSYKIPKADMEPSIQNLVRELKLDKKQEQALRAAIGELKKEPGFQFAPLEVGESKRGVYDFARNLVSLRTIMVSGHEIGHYAFYHLLSGKERLSYLQTMMDKVDAGYKMKEMIPDKTTNGADNFSEFFAEQWQQYLYSHRIPDSLHKPLVAKVIDVVERILMRYFKKDLVDKDLVKFFEPHLKERIAKERVKKAPTLTQRLAKAKKESKTELDEPKWLEENAPLSRELQKHGYSLKTQDKMTLEEKATLLKELEAKRKELQSRELTEEQRVAVEQRELLIQEDLRKRRAEAEEKSKAKAAKEGRAVKKGEEEEELGQALSEELGQMLEKDEKGIGSIVDTISDLARIVLGPEELAGIERRAVIKVGLRDRLERKKPVSRRKKRVVEKEEPKEETTEDILGEDFIEREFGKEELDFEDPTEYVNAAGEVRYLDEVFSRSGRPKGEPDTTVFSGPKETKEKVIRLPKHYNEEFTQWAKEQGIAVESKAEVVEAWNLYTEQLKEFEATQPKTTLGRVYKSAIQKLWNAGAVKNPSTQLLDSVQGEGGTQVLLMNVEKDIVPMIDYVWSPMFWAKKIPGLLEPVTALTRGQMRARYATQEHATSIRAISDTLSKEDQLRIRGVMEGKLSARNPAEAEAAAKMRSWFDHMRDKFKVYLKGIYRQELSSNQYQALDSMLAGATPKEVAARFNLDTKVLESIAKEYKDIDSWGLDQYVTRVERGSMRLLTEEGRLIGYVLSPKHAREKWREFALKNPEVKNVVLDVKHPHESLMELRKGEFHAVNEEMERELRSYMKALDKEFSKEALRGRKGPTVTPTLKFSAFAEKRKGRLEGERDIFNLSLAYARIMESKMHLDPAILEARKILPNLPPNAKAALTRLIEDTKGRYTAGDKLVDWMLGVVEQKSGGRVSFKKQGYSRAIAKAKTAEAWTKFAYRPIAGAINYASGLSHIWIKTSAQAIRDGQAFLKTPEGKAFIREIKPNLGVDIVEYMTGAGEIQFATKIGRRRKAAGGISGYLKDIAHPMGFFQAPEGPLRELSAATNYLLAKSKGATEEAARESAIRGVWFQEFTYNTAALPTWMRGPTGRLIGQFKPYLIKEIEFISSLRGAEIAKYMAMQTVLGGPRGFMYVIRSLPILSLAVPESAWREIDEWLDTEAPRLSRGVGGYLGVDVTAPAVFQFPTRLEDWMGPFLSDIMRLRKDVITPLMKGEGFGMEKPFMSPWTTAPTELVEWASGTVPILRHWNMMFEQMVDKDGWVKNERGQRMFHIGEGAFDQLAMVMKGVSGAGSLEQSLVRGSQRRLRQERQVRNANKSKLADIVVDQLSKGQELDDETVAEMAELGITYTTLRRNWKMRQLDPLTREFIKTELAKRGEVLERWTEFEGQPAGSNF